MYSIKMIRGKKQDMRNRTLKVLDIWLELCYLMVGFFGGVEGILTFHLAVRLAMSLTGLAGLFLRNRESRERRWSGERSPTHTPPGVTQMDSLK